MPAFPPLETLAPRSTNSSSDIPAPFEVICAWPVSGQYGPGSRILYYVLVAICVLARRAEWLRNACLAAALLLPLVAALHGIVLATVHNDLAVDLDIYGAFQLCSIGVLVAPGAATLSRTYFSNPGRNAIVLWSLLVVAGLISLTVEFYRVSGQPTPCWLDDYGNPLDANLPFPYEHANCSLVCNDWYPQSPIRGGSADNIFVVPVPYVLTFNVCIMLTAAMCIPAILLVAWMMVTSSHTNWTRRFGEQSALALKVPVKLFDADLGMPDLDTSTLKKIGIIGTESYRVERRKSICPLPRSVEEEQVEYHEGGLSDSSSSKGPATRRGVANMLQDYHQRSALSVYEFELDGRPLQIREVKLAAKVETFARQIYATLRDLENENVDVICVESVEVDDTTPDLAKVMRWLRNEEQAENESSRRKKRREHDRTPGAIILLALFSLAVCAILGIGERNLFSRPVNYQTEPMANVGQWAPVAGTILVVTGSIYVLIAEAMRKERRRMRAARPEGKCDDEDAAERDHADFVGRATQVVVQRLIKINDFFDAPRWLFDHSDFHRGQNTYPEIPGEFPRNERLRQQKDQYEPPRSSNDSIRSAATGRYSFAGSTASRHQEREAATPDLETKPPLRKRTLTLDVDYPRPRRSTTSPPDIPLEPIVPHNTNEHPTITFSGHDDEAVESDCNEGATAEGSDAEDDAGMERP